jgi:hypothetical protein
MVKSISNLFEILASCLYFVLFFCGRNSHFGREVDVVHRLNLKKPSACGYGRIRRRNVAFSYGFNKYVLGGLRKILTCEHLYHGLLVRIDNFLINIRQPVGQAESDEN